MQDHVGKFLQEKMRGVLDRALGSFGSFIGAGQVLKDDGSIVPKQDPKPVIRVARRSESQRTSGESELAKVRRLTRELNAKLAAGTSIRRPKAHRSSSPSAPEPSVPSVLAQYEALLASSPRAAEDFRQAHRDELLKATAQFMRQPARSQAKYVPKLSTSDKSIWSEYLRIIELGDATAAGQFYQANSGPILRARAASENKDDDKDDPDDDDPTCDKCGRKLSCSHCDE